MTSLMVSPETIASLVTKETIRFMVPEVTTCSMEVKGKTFYLVVGAQMFLPLGQEMVLIPSQTSRLAKTSLISSAIPPLTHIPLVMEQQNN
jgi:hypothetical protein